jgi:hypothetical protein
MANVFFGRDARGGGEEESKLMMDRLNSGKGMVRLTGINKKEIECGPTFVLIEKERERIDQLRD